MKNQLFHIKVFNHGKEITEGFINQIIFPILSKDAEGYFFIATGFFFLEYGDFITAKHVALNNDETEMILPMIVMQLNDNQTLYQRRCLSIVSNPNADIVTGKLLPIVDVSKLPVTNPIVIIKKTPVKIGEKVFTYAYPNSRLEEPKNGFLKSKF